MKHGPISVEFVKKVILIEDGEIVYACCGSDRPEEVHDLKNGKPNWAKVEEVSELMFKVKSIEGELDEAMRHLKKRSKGFSIWKTYYRKQLNDLRKRVHEIETLIREEV